MSMPDHAPSGEGRVEIDHVSITFSSRKATSLALAETRLTLAPGTFTALIGPSGCGKSTLLNAVAGFVEPSGGQIRIDGEPIEGPSRQVGVVFQQYALFPWFTALGNVKFGLARFNLPKADLHRRAMAALAEVGLERQADKYPGQLSGGMKQRTVIAISTILCPKVLIADEPSSALDVTSQKMVIKMLKELMEQGYIKSMIFITHELPLLYNVTDDIMVMYAGQIVEKGTAKEMVFDPIHPYSKGLMGSIIVPEEGVRDVKLTAIPGTPPNLKNPPCGCRFAERCKYVKPECRFVNIPLTEIGGGRAYRCIIPVEKLREVYEHE